MYAVSVTVYYKTPEGWAGAYELPAFYLDSAVQGIVSESHAEAVARSIVEGTVSATLKVVGGNAVRPIVNVAAVAVKYDNA